MLLHMVASIYQVSLTLNLCLEIIYIVPEHLLSSEQIGLHFLEDF